MQKILLFCLALLFCGGLVAQPTFVDQFDDGNVTATGDQFTYEEADNQLVISGTGNNGAWDGIQIAFGTTVDVTEAPVLYVRALASTPGQNLRIDLYDSNFNYTNVAPISNVLTGEYRELVYDFTGTDVGSLDLTDIQGVFMFINGGTAGFTGQIALDYVALGEAPAGVIMSDVYQDQMDSDSSLANFVNEVPGFTRTRSADDADPTTVTFVGDGTAGPWTPHVYAVRPAPDYIQTAVDISDNPVVYIKVRTSVPGTSFRVDVQDNDNISSIGNAVTRILTEEYVVYEYDYTGAFQNFENDACPTAATDPCDVDLEAIKELLIYVNGGTGQFAGTIDIDWISFGTNLDGEGPEAPLVYSDHFDNERVDFTGGTEGIEVSETESSMFFEGNGTSGQFGTVSYDFTLPTDDQDTARVQTTLDLSADGAQGKIFIRARTVGADQPVRIDIIDTTNLSTNILGLTKRFTNDWQIYTYDFSGNTGDAGYGGAEGCTPEMPCPLDMTAIKGIFFYPRPGEGMLEGTIEIDWLSVGQPLEEQMATEPGVINYSDTLVGAGEFFSGNPGGVTYSVSADGYLTLSGDGSSPTYQQVRYNLRDEEGNAGKADAAGSGDVLYVRARVRNADEAVLRIDLVDEFGFESTNAGSANTITGSDFATYEFGYAGRYEDGGYGGTSCASGPCSVDAQRITGMVFYPAPDTGGFTGDIDVNWVSFGQPISVNVTDFAQLEGLRVFPNPATERLGVEYTLPASSAVSVSLFDGLGRRVLVRDLGQRPAGENFQALDVAELPVGTYHLQVTVNGAPVRAQTVLKR